MKNLTPHMALFLVLLAWGCSPTTQESQFEETFTLGNEESATLGEKESLILKNKISSLHASDIKAPGKNLNSDTNESALNTGKGNIHNELFYKKYLLVQRSKKKFRVGPTQNMERINYGLYEYLQDFKSLDEIYNDLFKAKYLNDIFDTLSEEPHFPYYQEPTSFISLLVNPYEDKNLIEASFEYQYNKYLRKDSDSSSLVAAKKLFHNKFFKYQDLVEAGYQKEKAFIAKRELKRILSDSILHILESDLDSSIFRALIKADPVELTLEEKLEKTKQSNI